jgi:hypothetical protein
MIDQARLQLRRHFLRVEEFNGEFAIFCGLDPAISEYYYGLEIMGFTTRDEAEQYIRDYGSDEHVAELQAAYERDRQAMARSQTIMQLARDAGADDDL